MFEGYVGVVRKISNFEKKCIIIDYVRVVCGLRFKNYIKIKEERYKDVILYYFILINSKY